MQRVVSHVAVLVYHSSPLVEPGAGDAGGMTIYVREVAEALAARGVHTDIFTRSVDGRRRHSPIAPSVRVVSIDAGPARALAKEELTPYVAQFASGIGAFAAGHQLRYDIVHSHYWQSGLAGLSLSDAWEVPLVHSQHTLARVKNSFLAPGDKPEPRSRIEGEDRVTTEADVLIASTDEEWRQLSCLYAVAHDRIKAIHPGVDHGLFSPGDRGVARRELGLRDEVMLLYAGRIQPLKGLSLALHAVAQLTPALDGPLVFYVVGGASGVAGKDELSRLRRLAGDLGIQDCVRFVGAQPHVRLPVFYRAADAVLVCSYSESFGLSALEAHACGTPVVGTDVGGLSHIVRDGQSGFLVGSRDRSIFAARLKTLLSDDEMRSSFGRAARAAATQFSWEATAGQLLELYECLGRERQPELCTC
jgi:D-inositol-3-phosphate glycosyltransferase